jgi:TRAP-type mannitol/chloroaromatic compound transport system substrate-binding protein
MKKIKRRDFLKKAAVTGVAAGSALLSGAPAVHAKKAVNWRMVTAWPPRFPVLGEGADMLSKLVEEMSAGRMKIRVYGGGELVPPLETFDAVSQGVVEMGHGAAYYWAGKAPAAQFFTAIPFGMNAQHMNAWIYSGGGLELWKEVYADFGVVPVPAGNTGVQMGGWFNKDINSINDIKGLRMRIPGLGGKVIARAGGAAVLSAGSEIYTNLERGVIDATEWVGPYHDYLMGFYKVAKYYYYPGWHEPGSVLELIVNKKRLDRLPTDIQEIIRSAAYRTNIWMLSECEAKNNIYLSTLLKDHNIKLRKFPDDVLKAFGRYTEEVLHELTSSDPLSRKVYESFSAFKKAVAGWAEVSEEAYYSL